MDNTQISLHIPNRIVISCGYRIAHSVYVARARAIKSQCPLEPGTVRTRYSITSVRAEAYVHGLNLPAVLSDYIAEKGNARAKLFIARSEYRSGSVSHEA
jgi:hypothetical protein